MSSSGNPEQERAQAAEEIAELIYGPRELTTHPLEREKMVGKISTILSRNFPAPESVGPVCPKCGKSDLRVIVTNDYHMQVRCFECQHRLAVSDGDQFFVSDFAQFFRGASAEPHKEQK